MTLAAIFVWTLATAIIAPAKTQAQIGTTRDEARTPDAGITEQVRIEVPAMWQYTDPLIAPEPRERDPSLAQKDPSVVFHDGKWHIFMTVKLTGRTVIEYCSFENWLDADKSPRTILTISDSDYYCAPQVFYFIPQQKWYLIYQMGVAGKDMMWVAYSTTTDIGDPHSWTPAQSILDGGEHDPRQVGGLDYWIICDDAACVPVPDQPERPDVATVDATERLSQRLWPL